jgi:uncharacterized protein
MVIKLSGLSSQNPWWKKENWEYEDNDIKKIEILLERKNLSIKKGEIYLIRGVRRAGKTVYTKLLIKELTKEMDGKNIMYLSCDRHTVREIKNIVDEFRKRLAGEAVIFDEITYHHQWNILLKELSETTDLTIIATGSNPVNIQSKKDRLPGRKIEGNEYFLNPLNFREYVENVITHKNKINYKTIQKLGNSIKNTPSFSPLHPTIEETIPYFDDLEPLFYSYLISGGFPDAVLSYWKNGRINEKTYEMIIRLFLGILSKEKKNESIGRQIMEKILRSMGSRIDFSTIAKDIEVHHNTVKEYIELLENARIIYLLPAWDINKKRYAPRKQKKIIFQSSLIPQALHQYTTGCSYDDTLEFLDKNLDHIVEDTISSHIIQSLEIPLLRERHSFAGFYYAKKECDLVISSDQKFYGYESKFGKLKKEKYPFETRYITKDTIDKKTYPASLFLAGLKKSNKSI